MSGRERLLVGSLGLLTYPTLTLLLGVLLHGHIVTRRQLAAMALCYLGIAVAFAHDLDAAGEARAVWIGGTLVFASSVSYAFYLTGHDRPPGRGT